MSEQGLVGDEATGVIYPAEVELAQEPLPGLERNAPEVLGVRNRTLMEAQPGVLVAQVDPVDPRGRADGGSA